MVKTLEAIYLETLRAYQAGEASSADLILAESDLREAIS